IISGPPAAACGAAAPDNARMHTDIQSNNTETGSSPPEWKDLKMMPGGTASGGSVGLDAIYPDAIQDRFVLFSAGTTKQLGRVKSVVELARRGFGLVAKVSQIEVEGIDLSEATGFGKKVRETTIYLETARESLLVVDADVQVPQRPTDSIAVKDAVSLPIGRRVVLVGEQWVISGKAAQIGEVATVKSWSATGDGYTELVFERSLANSFHSKTLTVLANCVGASHGETPASGAELIGDRKSVV